MHVCVCVYVCLCFYLITWNFSLSKKRLGETNRTSISEKFNPEGDSGNGFRIEPLKGNTAQNPYPIYTNGDNHPNGSSQLRTQRSYVQRGSGQLSRFSNSMAPTRDGSQFGSMRDAIVNQRWLEDGSENFNLSQRLLEKPNGIRKDDPSSSSKESIMVKTRSNTVVISLLCLYICG
jgi:hypothetical protein